LLSPEERVIMRRGLRGVVACLFLLTVVFAGGCDKKSQTPDKAIDLPKDGPKAVGKGAGAGPNKAVD
jgi:hypothetical protein